MRFLLVLCLLFSAPAFSASSPNYHIDPLQLCRLSMIAEDQGGGLQEGLLPMLLPYWNGQKLDWQETKVSFVPEGEMSVTLLRFNLAQYVIDQANYYVGPSPAVSKPKVQEFVQTPNSLVVDGHKILTMPPLNPYVQSVDLWNYGVLLFRRNLQELKGTPAIELMRFVPAWATVVKGYLQLFVQSLLMAYHNLPEAPAKYSKYHLLPPAQMAAVQTDLAGSIHDSSLSVPESLDYSRSIQVEGWKETFPDLLFAPALSYVGSLIQFGSGGKPQRRKIVFAVFRTAMLMLSERYKKQDFDMDPAQENQEVIDIVKTFLESEMESSSSK